MQFNIQNKEQSFEIHNDEEGCSLTYPPHLHKHVEIILLEHGTAFAKVDSKSEILNSGDLFIVFPNQLHSYIDETKTILRKMIIFSPDLCPEYQNEFTNYIPVCNVLPAAIKNKNIIYTILNIINCTRLDSCYSEIMVRGSLLFLLGELFSHMPLEKHTTCDPELELQIINYCYKNYHEDISLLTLSRDLHISSFNLSVFFNKKLNVNFRDYINGLRIGEAINLLKIGQKSITEIAYQVGFNSIRTFNRCFFKYMGMSPKEYRINILKSFAS